MIGFRNHPMLELRRPEVREDLAAALAALDGELPLRPGAIVGGAGETGEGATSTDPCTPGREGARRGGAAARVAGRGGARAAAAARALDLALASGWPARAPADRAAVLERAAELM